jgi:hypothetical protein
MSLSSRRLTLALYYLPLDHRLGNELVPLPSFIELSSFLPPRIPSASLTLHQEHHHQRVIKCDTQPRRRGSTITSITNELRDLSHYPCREGHPQAPSLLHLQAPDPPLPLLIGQSQCLVSRCACQSCCKTATKPTLGLSLASPYSSSSLMLQSSLSFLQCTLTETFCASNRARRLLVSYTPQLPPKTA